MVSSIVGTSTTPYAVAYPCVRKCFHASRRFWAFYSDGINMVYRTSTDGATWSGPTIIGACGRGYGFSVWFDGKYLHYALCYPSDAPTYRRGEPMADGSIMWSAPEQIFWQLSGHTSHLPSISVDFAGYPFITFLRGTSEYEYYPIVMKSSKNDGTWETSPGFPYQLQTVDNSSNQDMSLVPLTGGKMYVAYNYYRTMRGRLWDGSSWGDEEIIATDTSAPACFSVVREGDDVHLAFSNGFTNGNQDIIYIKRTYGVGWGIETVVHVRVTAALALIENTPILSIDGNGTIYCFWIDSPILNHIFYKKCVDDVWDATPTDLGDTGPYDLIYLGITGSHGAYDGYVSLLYYKYNSSPYDVKHNYLSGMTPYVPEPGVYLAPPPMEPRTCYEVEGCAGTTVTEFNVGDLIKASAQYFCEGSEPERWHDFFGETVGCKWYHNDELIGEAEMTITGHWWNLCVSWQTDDLPAGSGYVEFYWNGIYKGRTNDYTVVGVAPLTFCEWLDDHGAPGLSHIDIQDLIAPYESGSHVPGYGFSPSSLEICGSVKYYNGDDGDPSTECDFFP